MFTGIIEETGTVEAVEPREAGVRLRVRCRAVLEGSREGDSICVSGVCLTAVDLRPDSFSADVSPETLRRSSLGALGAGSKVNLERALAASGRLGGHIVQGHIDGTGEFLGMEPLGADNWRLRVRFPEETARYLVFKGSVAIDGVSLTVAEIEGDALSAAIVPHTWRNTTLGLLRPGDPVNIECDVLAKYVERLLGAIERPAGLTLERLKDLGY